MTFIHNKEVNNIAEYNLLHDNLIHFLNAKKFNIHYSPNIHGFMNTRKGKAKFKNYQIILDSGCSSMVLIVRMVEYIIKDMM